LHVLGGHTVHDEARTTGSELRISLAGIAVNLLGAAAAGAAIRMFTGSFPGAPSLAVAPHLLLVVWGVNLWLAMFNLLPGIPFDGGHAAETLLARKFPRRRARIAVLTSGTIIAGALIVLGLTGQDMLLSFVGFSALMAVVAGWRTLREESAGNEAFLGTYDFSNGYTSLEKGAPKPPPRESRAEIRRREREKADAEAREAAAAREVRDAKARLDRLLDRIAADGISSLTTEERAFLNEQSRRLRDRVK
ncbi:MAG TPA: site-2 protease family protein, partial [Planctomycetota bacterium]|nr:site-2 protease family protein [Planctomycetota bacterium]